MSRLPRGRFALRKDVTLVQGWEQAVLMAQYGVRFMVAVMPDKPQ
jgi:hypothetical protein